TEHWRLGRKQVLGNFTPTDAAMNLDEITAPVDFDTQGATAFQLTINLAFQLLDLDEGVLALPKGLEGLTEDQVHIAPTAPGIIPGRISDWFVPDRPGAIHFRSKPRPGRFFCAIGSPADCVAERSRLPRRAGVL